MIKKLIGIIVALAVIVVIIISALHYDKYESMLSGEEAAEFVPEPAAPAAESSFESAAPMDSLSISHADSLKQ